MSDLYNARLQTVSSRPCPHPGGHALYGTEGSSRLLCLADTHGGWWQITALHPPMTCHMTRAGHPVHVDRDSGADWFDRTPGAVPHCEPELEPEPVASTSASIEEICEIVATWRGWDSIKADAMTDEEVGMATQAIFTVKAMLDAKAREQ